MHCVICWRRGGDPYVVFSPSSAACLQHGLPQGASAHVLCVHRTGGALEKEAAAIFASLHGARSWADTVAKSTCAVCEGPAGDCCPAYDDGRACGVSEETLGDAP